MKFLYLLEGNYASRNIISILGIKYKKKAKINDRKKRVVAKLKFNLVQFH